MRVRTVFAQKLVRLQAVCLITAALATPAFAQGDAVRQQFREAYYQQTHEKDYAAAAAGYEKVVADSSAPESLRAEAKHRLAQCREEQVATNLAQLMPADTLFYAEISRPGEHLAQLLELVGLARHTTGDAGSAQGAASLPGGLMLPADFAVSPALVGELKKIRGAAVAITGVATNGKPSGVAVIHPGDFDLWRGVIETGIQVLPAADPVSGFKVYQVQGEVWIAATERLFVVSDSRDQLAQTVARLQSPKSDSLATQPPFSRLAADRKSALVFAYVNGQRAMQVAAPHLRGQEAMVAQMMLDLAHLESASAVVGTSDQGIHAQAKVVMTEGHRNLAYAMVRTAPLTRRSLAHVPAGAAAVAVLGLNPADASAGTSGGATPGLTAMDIGREVFSNVEEISLFVLASKQSETASPLPEIGMIAAVKDAAKSEALWDQLLSLAAMIEPRVAQPPVEIEIEGLKAKEYRFQGAPPIVVARLADRALAAGTREAVNAAIRADGSQALTGDAQFKPLLDELTPESSKAVLVHAGRMMGVVASTMPRNGDEVRQAATLIGNLRLMMVTSEKPNEFSIRAAAAGLPNVPNIAQAAIAANAPRRSASVRIQPPANHRTVQRAEQRLRIEDQSVVPLKP